MNAITKALGFADKPVQPAATKNKPALPKAVTAWRQYNGEIDATIEADENVIAHDQALTNTNYNLIRDVQAQAGNAQSNKVRTIESHAKAGMAVPPDVMLSLEESITKTKQRVRDLMADGTKVTGDLVGNQEANKAVTKYLPYLAAWSPEAQPIEVELPEGALIDVVAAQRAERSRLRASRKDVRNALPSADGVKADLLEKHAANARAGKPTVSFVGTTAKLRLPMVGVDAEPNSLGLGDGSLPVAPDAHALAAFFFHDQIAEIIKADVDAFYVGKNALSATAKAKRLAEIDAAILMAERVEVTAIRALRAQGISFAFRPDTDPRAILGVDGPIPQARRE